MEADIKAVLPHRYPFLLVDRLVHADAERFECLKNVSFNEPHFNGHFPDEPVMPGVLILEALAQAAGLALGTLAEDDPGTGYLTGIERARFRRKVVPGDVLRLTGEFLLNRRGLVKVQAEALVGSETAAEASLSFIYRRS